MSERQADFEMLRAFVRQADQTAFAAVARRHLDLVYATALRKVSDAGAAEEIAQNVFAALGRKAWQLVTHDQYADGVTQNHWGWNIAVALRVLGRWGLEPQTQRAIRTNHSELALLPAFIQERLPWRLA